MLPYLYKLFCHNFIQLYSKIFQLDDNVDLQAIAASCNGYVGADLEALVREAARFAHRRLSGTVRGGDRATIIIKMEDWESARSEFRPSVTKGVTKEVAKVSWDDIGGLKNLKVKSIDFQSIKYLPSLII